MKKKLALLMCVVMLLGSLLICIPTSAAAANVPENSNLAITEVCYAPKNEKYEFIEVVNVNTAGTSINLKDYYIYRIAFSNGGAGNYQGTGALKVLGLKNETANRFAYVSFAGLVGDDGKVVESAMLVPNSVAVIWFASAASKDESTSDFKRYWSSRGADMDDTVVYKLPVYKLNDDGTPALDKDGNGINLWAANDTKYTGSAAGLIGVNGNAGSSFLPDQEAGVVFALVKKTYAEMDLTPERIAEYYAFTVNEAGDRVYAKKDVPIEHTKARLANADCVVYFMLNNKTRKDVSAHYYDFIDKAKFAEGAKGETFPSKIPEVNRYIPQGTDLPNGLMVAERVEADKENTYVLYDNESSNKAIVVPEIDLKYLSNPGKLYKGQLGIETGETPALDAANGEGSFVMKEYKEEVPSIASGSDAEEGEEGEDTVAQNTSTDTQAADGGEEKKGGCGSLVASSAIAILAPVTIIGCGVTFKRKRRGK